MLGSKDEVSFKKLVQLVSASFKRLTQGRGWEPRRLLDDLVETAEPFKNVVHPDERRKLITEDQATLEVAAWKRFDLTFGSVVILNGMMIGVEIEDNGATDPGVFVATDLVFLCCFVTELGLRLHWLRRKLKTKN